MNQPDGNKTQRDEAEILQLIAQWSRAVEAKDTGALTKHYAEDAVLYDAIPPYKAEGAECIRKAWDCCLPYFPEEFKSEHRDVTIHVDGNVALMHALHHFLPNQADHPCGQSWMRVTVGYRRIGGEWKVVHEHASLPFNPMNNHAWQIPNPDVVDGPDYSAPCDSQT